MRFLREKLVGFSFQFKCIYPYIPVSISYKYSLPLGLSGVNSSNQQPTTVSCENNDRSVALHEYLSNNFIQQFYVPSHLSCVYLCCENTKCNGIYFREKRCFHALCTQNCDDEHRSPKKHNPSGKQRPNLFFYKKNKIYSRQRGSGTVCKVNGGELKTTNLVVHFLIGTLHRT